MVDPHTQVHRLIRCESPVHVWDVGDTKGPVEGGARCSVEDARDAANLVVFPMDCMKGFIAIECKVIHCIIARSWRLSVAPEDKEWFVYIPTGNSSGGHS